MAETGGLSSFTRWPLGFGFAFALIAVPASWPAVGGGASGPSFAPSPVPDQGTSAPSETAAPDSLVIGADRRVMLTLVGGERLMFRMESAGPSVPILNPETAERLALQGTGGIARLRVGPVRIRGLVGRIGFTIGGVSAERRVIWYDRAVAAPPAVGELGPYALPQARIVFALRSPGPDEVLYSLPMNDEGLQGPMTHAQINGERTEIRFDLSRAETVATAAAASALAVELGGELVGPNWRMPIYMGIERPVRRVALTRPFVLGPIRIDHFAARLTDYGDTSDIPVSEVDPGETLVRGRNYDDILRRIQIGADALKHCSQLIFDKAAHEIQLRCKRM